MHRMLLIQDGKYAICGAVEYAYLKIFYHVLRGLRAAERDDSKGLHEAVEDLLFRLVVFRRQRQHRGTGDDKSKNSMNCWQLFFHA
jgi:hypothetical protein